VFFNILTTETFWTPNILMKPHQKHFHNYEKDTDDGNYFKYLIVKKQIMLNCTAYILSHTHNKTLKITSRFSLSL